MFNLHHLDVHLRCMHIRKQVGLRPHACVISEDAEFLADVPSDLAELYSVVAQSTVRELLDIDDDRYRAVLSAPAGSANSGLLCQQTLEYLHRTYPDRFVYADFTSVDRVAVDDEGAVVHADGHRVTAGRVVLCTNGFVDHVVEDVAGSPCGSPTTRRSPGGSPT
jgi:glycine/D-amino acid oxidase-like deaminating enzyme